MVIASDTRTTVDRRQDDIMPDGQHAQSSLNAQNNDSQSNNDGGGDKRVKPLSSRRSSSSAQIDDKDSDRRNKRPATERRRTEKGGRRRGYHGRKRRGGAEMGLTRKRTILSQSCRASIAPSTTAEERITDSSQWWNEQHEADDRLEKISVWIARGVGEHKVELLV